MAQPDMGIVWSREWRLPALWERVAAEPQP